MSQLAFFIPYFFLTDMSKQNNESKLKYSLSVRVNDTQNELNMEFSFVGDDYPDIAILSSMTKCLVDLDSGATEHCSKCKCNIPATQEPQDLINEALNS